MNRAAQKYGRSAEHLIKLSFWPKMGSGRKLGGAASWPNRLSTMYKSTGAGTVASWANDSRRPPDYSSNLCPPKTFAI